MFYKILLKITVLLFKVTIYLTNEAMPLLLLQLGGFAIWSQEVQTQSLISYSLVEVKIAKLLGGVYTLSHLAETRLKGAQTRDPILHLIIVEDDPLRGVLFIPDVADIVARVVGRAHMGDEGVKFVPNSAKYREKSGVATFLKKPQKGFSLTGWGILKHE